MGKARKVLWAVIVVLPFIPTLIMTALFFAVVVLWQALINSPFQYAREASSEVFSKIYKHLTNTSKGLKEFKQNSKSTGENVDN